MCYPFFNFWRKIVKNTRKLDAFNKCAAFGRVKAGGAAPRPPPGGLRPPGPPVTRSRPPKAPQTPPRPIFSFFGCLILHFLRNLKKKNLKKYALTIVLLLNNLAGAFAREKMSFFGKIDFEARFGICVKNGAEWSRNQPISMQPARVTIFPFLGPLLRSRSK